MGAGRQKWRWEDRFADRRVPGIEGDAGGGSEPSPGQQTTITLDGASKGRIVDGLGAASAGASSRLLIDYPEPQRSQPDQAAWKKPKSTIEPPSKSGPNMPRPTTISVIC
jgi:Glycosyl hydrolase family 59